MVALAVVTTGLPCNDCPMSVEFWGRVVQAFANAGYETSQNAIARELGVTQGAISKWSLGSAFPKLPKIVQIAKMTGASVEWLLTGNNKRSDDVDQQTELLLERWAHLPQEERERILEFVEFRAQRAEPKVVKTKSGPSGPSNNH